MTVICALVCSGCVSSRTPVSAPVFTHVVMFWLRLSPFYLPCRSPPPPTLNGDRFLPIVRPVGEDAACAAGAGRKPSNRTIEIQLRRLQPRLTSRFCFQFVAPLWPTNLKWEALILCVAETSSHHFLLTYDVKTFSDKALLTSSIWRWWRASDRLHLIQSTWTTCITPHDPASCYVTSPNTSVWCLWMQLRAMKRFQREDLATWARPVLVLTQSSAPDAPSAQQMLSVTFSHIHKSEDLNTLILEFGSSTQPPAPKTWVLGNVDQGEIYNRELSLQFFLLAVSQTAYSYILLNVFFSCLHPD